MSSRLDNRNLVRNTAPLERINILNTAGEAAVSAQRKVIQRHHQESWIVYRAVTRRRQNGVHCSLVGCYQIVDPELRLIGPAGINS